MFYWWLRQNLMMHFLWLSFCKMDLKKPYRLDRCSKGGNLLLFAWNNISSQLLTEHKTTTNLECTFIEISLRKKSWLLCCFYNPHKSNTSTHLHHLSKGLDIHMNKYGNILFLGDCNSETLENYLNDFAMFTMCGILLRNQYVSRI